MLCMHALTSDVYAVCVHYFLKDAKFVPLAKKRNPSSCIEPQMNPQQHVLLVLFVLGVVHLQTTSYTGTDSRPAPVTTLLLQQNCVGNVDLTYSLHYRTCLE